MDKLFGNYIKKISNYNVVSVIRRFRRSKTNAAFWRGVRAGKRMARRRRRY